MLDVNLRAGVAGRQRQFDDRPRADGGGIGGKCREDRVGRVAGLVDQLVRADLPAGPRLLRQAREERRIGAAEQTEGIKDTRNVFTAHAFTNACDPGRSMAQNLAQPSLFLPFSAC